jgi:DNA-binding NarL/FixJ family response regulator
MMKNEAKNFLGILPPISWLACVDPRIKELTLQEIAVLNLMRSGLPDKLVADALGLSISAVRFHWRNASPKIGCRSRIEAALWADRNFWPPGFFQKFST